MITFHFHLKRSFDSATEIGFFFFKNFLLMEPLGQTGATGKSTLSQEEAVVASIRSAMKELQESIQDLCKASVAKIVKLG